MNPFTIVPTVLLAAMTLQNPVLVAPAPGAQEGRKPVATLNLPTRMVLLDVGDLFEIKTAESSSDPRDGNDTPEMRRMRATGNFAGILERWMKPSFDAAADHIEVVAPGRVSLVATEAQLDWADRFCRLQRSETDLVFVQIHIIEGAPGMLKSLGVDAGTKTLQRPAELESLLAQAKNLASVDMSVCPRLMIRARQQARMSTGESISYVKDWRMETVEPGPRDIAVPTIGNLFNGHEIEATALPIEQDTYGLDLNFTTSKVERPLPTKKMRIGSGEGQEVEVASPVSHQVTLKTRISLADGGSVVFGMMSNDEHREVAVAVTLQRGAPDPQPR
jgi:hypothetical protein